MSPLEQKLRQLAAALDDAALEALASKGLLRRAQKDFERESTIAISSDDAASLRISVGQHRVTMPEAGPAKATCSCPAAGVCQHILTAVLFLRQTAPVTSPEAAAQSQGDAAEQGKGEVLRLTAEQLEQWAGKPAFRAALKIVAQAPLEIVAERGLRVRFNNMNAECHFVPGAGLDGVIVSGGRGDPRAFVAAAVIGVQRANGVVWASVETERGLEESSGSPRSRAEVLDSCHGLLMETVDNGLSRLSSANQQRWATLAISALGVNLPRLALVLRSISDEASLVVARDARADLGRMLGRMAQAHALGTALRTGGDSPRPDLVGVHRSQYLDVGNLDLVGVGAWPWRTQSGYEGLTVLFWDSAAKRWCSWSDSRPRHQLAGFSAAARYGQVSPWEGAESPRQLARSSFRLINARRNAAFRLSSSSRSRVLVTGPADAVFTAMPLHADWTTLEEQLASQERIGLAEPDPLGATVAIRPALWRERVFDPVRQVFTWGLLDHGNRRILLELPFDDLTQPAIRALEAFPTDSLTDAVLIGRASRTEQGTTVYPFSIYRPKSGVTCLALDTATIAATCSVPAPDAASDETDWDVPETDINGSGGSGSMLLLLDELDDALLALAEGGTANSSLARREKLREIAARLKRWRMEALVRVVECLLRLRSEPANVLRCLYVSQLCRRVDGL